MSDCIFCALVSTSGLDEHRRRDFYRSVVSALFLVMEFLVRMIRLLLEGVVNSKTKEKKKKRTEILQTGNVQSSPRMFFVFLFFSWFFFLQPSWTARGGGGVRSLVVVLYEIAII